MSPVPADPRIAAAEIAINEYLDAVHVGSIETHALAVHALAAADAVPTPADAELVRAAEEALRHLDRSHYPTYRQTWDDLRTALDKYVARAAVVSPPASDLFVDGEFTSHAGLQLPYKIDCDALTDADLATLAGAIAARIEPFGVVEGIPRGGLRLAEALKPYATAGSLTLLLVDDVCTTGSSFREHYAKVKDEAYDVRGAVIFARGPVPSWVTALFVETRAVVSPPDALARETELRRAAEQHVKDMQAYIETLPYPSDLEDARVSPPDVYEPVSSKHINIDAAKDGQLTVNGEPVYRKIER